MALLTDGPLSTLEDLTGHDSQLLEIANVEQIDVGRKLALAQEEVEIELTSLLSRSGSETYVPGVSARPGTSGVVATSPLKLWHAFRTLELVYRDAFHSQLNDRYAGKRDEFHNMARWAREQLVQIGIGIATNPVARAMTPAIDETTGSLPYGIYYVTLAWVNEAGEEGASAEPAVASVNGHALRVKAAGPPANAKGWNVFAGDGPETMTLQNGEAIPLTECWTLSGALTTGRRRPGSGQAPNYLRPAPRTIQRG